MAYMFNKSDNKKGIVNQAFIWMAVIFGIILLVSAGVSFAKNGNGLYNWIYGDVTSGTDPVPSCTPKKYVVQMHGTFDVINQKQGTWTLDYDIDFLDTHISDISLKPLGIFTNDFTGKVCLYDVLGGNKKIDCVNIENTVTKGQIERYPFEFSYNLYDKDCNGQVDDHTFNLVAELQTEQDFERHEKTVAIVGGQPVFQNAKGY